MSGTPPPVWSDDEPEPPEPPDSREPPEPHEPVPAVELARNWAELACRTAYLPLPASEVERQFTTLMEQLVAGLRGQAADLAAVVSAGVNVGAALVEVNLVGTHRLVRTIELLGEGLPRLAELRDVDGLPARVLRVLAGLAGGYSQALRHRTFEEQEAVKEALLKAKATAERGLRVSEARFREVFSASAVGIAISDLDGVLTEANAFFANLVGRDRDALPGMPLMKLLQAEDDVDLGAAYRALTEGQQTSFRRRRSFTTAAGGDTWAYIVASPLRDADGAATHHITVVEDITELQLLRRELSDQTLHDALTGLPNEQYFTSHLQQVLERADPIAQITIGRINLDNFAVINVGIGRETGAQLLRVIAGRLRDLVATEKGMVARTGPDDFAFIIEDGPATPDVQTLGARINEVLAEPEFIGDRGLAVSACVGLVRRSAGGISPGELIRAADATLHRTKRGGRGQWGFYDAQADAEERERYRLAAEMPGSWESGEVHLEYQPVCGLASGRVVALQALLRWDRADGAVLTHPQCLALAEQTGLVNLLGPWMLREACAELARWSAALQNTRLMLRVDLTPRLSQDPDLVRVVRAALDETGVPASHLRVGVPMVTLSKDRGDVTDNVQVLADLDAAVVLLGAAAGPGYMAFVEDLPVTAVEVAPDVVRRIAQRPGDDSLVSRAIRETIPLLHSAGTKVIASDVDTPEQADWWRGAGADAARGAHFGLPVPPDRLPAFLA